MRFGPVPLAEAEGAILAHSVALPDGGRLGKGRVLGPYDIARLRAAGIAQVTVARLEPGEVAESAAAARLGARLAAPGLRVTAPVAGRVNLVAEAAGLVAVDAAQVHALNAIDEAITLATLADRARVAPRALAATLKIIPYAVTEAALAAAEAVLDRPPLRLHPFRPRPVRLILTRASGSPERLIDKGEAALRARLGALGVGPELIAAERVAHETGALAAALAGAAEPLVLILAASATSDRADVVPAAIEAAGGRVERFGMPVDPGNLSVLGRRGAAVVLGLPGCIRSPALNGADWLLERILADLPPDGAEIARMGVGGLLKEIPARGRPRRAAAEGARAPDLILLAAGASRRMGGQDKLLREVAGEPLLRRQLRRLAAAPVARVIVVLRPGDEARRAAIADLLGGRVQAVEAPDWAEGMAASIRAGMRALSPGSPAVVIALADMPEIGPEHVRALVEAFDPEEGREICRAVTAGGRPGHPVLFGRRFFESLMALSGDEGARAVIRAHPEFLVEVPTPGEGAAVDLDTPEAWAAWEAGREPGVAT
ncbi:MAG: 4-diphosphocytidyl-2C-methyl-D-erythritol kinase [Alphaproteobacteria bacterium]|nr:MAG: 4-diphosphocytidyl-2C-methyl-D-erythritol kinase [Alphaproteobacteria bacterium]